MKNKNLSLKGILVAVAVGFMSMGYCSAITNFHFNIEAVKAIQESLLDDIMQIHFADNGNDFGGFFYFSNGLGNESEGGTSQDLIYYACTATGRNEFGEEELITKWVLTESECTGGLFSDDSIEPVFDDTNTAIDAEGNPFPTNDPEIDEYQYRVSMNGNSYICSRQVKGYYYNAERGERLWPLDGETWSDVVETTGGFYTMCKKELYIGALKECLNEAKNSAKNYYDCKDQARKLYATDGDGYYGSIKHVFSGQELNLIAGVKYDPTTKFTSIDAGTGFSPTFIRFGNKYPLGFIYDNNGGVGFVGCRVKNINDIKTIIGTYNQRIAHDQTNPLDTMFIDNNGDSLSYTVSDGASVSCTGLSWDSLIGVVIEGIVGMGEVGNTANFDVIGNQKDEKMQYFSSANINNNTIINYARKKAELLCRGKWKMPGDSIDPNNNKDGIICTSGRNITEAQSDSIKNAGITLIVKNGNVEINPFKSDEINNNNNNKYYDIFIDSGNLIINETESTDKFVIKDNGFVSSTRPNNFNLNVLVDYFGASPTSIIRCMDEDDCSFEGWIDGLNQDFNGDGTVDSADIVRIIQDCGGGACEVGNDVTIASIIKGNFIVNGNILGPESSENKLNNKYFIYGKLSSRDSFQSLQDTFAWRCNNGYTTDDSYCLPTNKERSYNNPYEDAFLVVIDQNYENSPFFSAS